MAFAPQIDDCTLVITNWTVVIAHAHSDERMNKGVDALSRSLARRAG
jgi:hypothetical protein